MLIVHNTDRVDDAEMYGYVDTRLEVDAGLVSTLAW
jgi:hypothetical protein